MLVLIMLVLIFANVVKIANFSYKKTYWGSKIYASFNYAGFNFC